MHDPETNKEGQTPQTPPHVPDHELIRLIGEGSYGEVWLARNSLGTHRAVKVIHCGRFKDNDRPYEREFTGLKNFEPISRGHEGLVDILQVGRTDDDGYFYYVMELADDGQGKSPKSDVQSPKVRAENQTGAPPSAASEPKTLDWQNYHPLTLEDKVHANGRLPVAECIRIATTLADALRYLHERQLVHRDIKPSNIVFVDGVPKLADVGLVARTDSARTFVGTEGFIPPEGPGTPQADIYSLGKCLYEMAMGKDRQAFPSPPTLLDELPDRQELLELNEIINKACDPEPADRYPSAQAMLEELQLLQSGKSVTGARKRGQQLRLAARAGAIAGGGALVALLIWAIQEQAKPEILFHDDFDGAQLDTNKWTVGHVEHRFEGRFGKPWFQVEQAGGELVLQARADHEDGWSVAQKVWADLNGDLREWFPCRLEIEMAGTVTEGSLALTMIGDRSPPSPEESRVPGAVLASLNASNHQINGWPPQRMRVDLLPNVPAAVVYRDPTHLDEFEVFDLSALPRWGLRIYAYARTSRGMPSAAADFRIKNVRVIADAGNERAVGRLIEVPSEWPLKDVVIKNQRGQVLAKTGENGAFVLPVEPDGSSLTVEKPGYVPVDGQRLTARELRRFSTLQLYRPHPGFGDIVEVFPFGEVYVHSFGFRSNVLTALVHDSDTNCSLRPLDLSVRPVVTMLTGAVVLEFEHRKLLGEFVECGSRLIGIKRWHGAVVDITSQPPQMLRELTHPDGSTLSYTDGAVFDGELLWFVENDATNQRYAIHAFDLDRKDIVRSLTTKDKGISGIAWDGDRFWISNPARKLVYEVDRKAALQLGTLEMGIGRSFPGNYSRLAFGQGHLWGFESGKRRVCKIKITD